MIFKVVGVCLQCFKWVRKEESYRKLLDSQILRCKGLYIQLKYKGEVVCQLIDLISKGFLYYIMMLVKYKFNVSNYCYDNGLGIRSFY